MMDVNTHLSYQALGPCSNKYLRRKWDMENYIAHRKRIQLAKPLIDNDAPRAPIHMHLKLNKLQAEEVHVSRVEKENRMLMEKISYTMRSKGKLENWNVYTTNNFTNMGRHQALLRTSHENQAILKRIAMSRPAYDHRRWEDEWRMHQGYMLHMSRYPDKWDYKKYAIRYSSPFKQYSFTPKISSWNFGDNNASTSSTGLVGAKSSQFQKLKPSEASIEKKDNRLSSSSI